MKHLQIKSGVWMGLVWAMCLGTGAAQAPSSAPAAGQGQTVAASEKAPKKELTAEQKAFVQSLKALRAGSDRMNEKFVKEERKREKAEETEAAAERMPSISSNGPSAKSGAVVGSQGGAVADSALSGKGK